MNGDITCMNLPRQTEIPKEKKQNREACCAAFLCCMISACAAAKSPRFPQAVLSSYDYRPNIISHIRTQTTMSTQ